MRIAAILATALILAGCSSSSSTSSSTSGSTGATTAGTATTSATTTTGGTVGGTTTGGSSTTAGGSTTSTGSTSTTTGTSTTTSSAGTSGGTMTLSGSAAQTIASAYYSFGRYRRDGGIDKGTVIMFGGTNSVSCAEFSSDAGVPKGLDGHVLELAVLNKSADVQAGTYPVGEFISVILGNADGGAALAIGVHSFVDGGGALEYDATQGSLTISNPDGVSDLTGSFSTQAVQDGGTTADLSGSFDLPYCQSAH